MLRAAPLKCSEFHLRASITSIAITVGGAKVADLYHASVSIRCVQITDNNIIRFQISMNDGLGMNIFYPAYHPDEHFKTLHFGNPTTLTDQKTVEGFVRMIFSDGVWGDILVTYIMPKIWTWNNSAEVRNVRPLVEQLPYQQFLIDQLALFLGGLWIRYKAFYCNESVVLILVVGPPPGTSYVCITSFAEVVTHKLKLVRQNIPRLLHTAVSTHAHWCTLAAYTGIEIGVWQVGALVRESWA